LAGLLASKKSFQRAIYACFLRPGQWPANTRFHYNQTDFLMHFSTGKATGVIYNGAATGRKMVTLRASRFHTFMRAQEFYSHATDCFPNENRQKGNSARTAIK
jgi:hypothetical protein